jgi:hypothetical protein
MKTSSKSPKVIRAIEGVIEITPGSVIRDFDGGKWVVLSVKPAKFLRDCRLRLLSATTGKTITTNPLGINVDVAWN